MRSPIRASASPMRSSRSEEHTSELQSRRDLVCRLLLEKKKKEGFQRAQILLQFSMRNFVIGHRSAEEFFLTGQIQQSVSGEAEQYFLFLFFFNDTATTEIYTLSLHDALPIFQPEHAVTDDVLLDLVGAAGDAGRSEEHTSALQSRRDLVCRLLLEKKKTT